jgi:hypothetical protein
MEFRDACREDVPAIVAMLADDVFGGDRESGRDRESAEVQGSAGVPPEYWRAFAAIDADPRNQLIVADSDGEPVGVVQITYIPSLSRRGAERLSWKMSESDQTCVVKGLGGK